MDDAKRAGLVDRGKDESAKKANNWNKFPKEMLRARCKAAAARMVAPEALNGMWTSEELSDGAVHTFESAAPAAAPKARAALATVEVSDAERAHSALEESLLRRIAMTSSDGERKALIRDISAADKDQRLKGAAFERVKAAYLARWPSITKAPDPADAMPPVNAPAPHVNADAGPPPDAA